MPARQREGFYYCSRRRVFCLLSLLESGAKSVSPLVRLRLLERLPPRPNHLSLGFLYVPI